MRQGAAAPQGASAQAQGIVRAAAGRIARKEIVIATKAAQRYANDPEEYKAAIVRGFDRHTLTIMGALQIDQTTAAVESRIAMEAASKGLAAMEDWEETRTHYLTGLALEIEKEHTT